VSSNSTSAVCLVSLHYDFSDGVIEVTTIGLYSH